MRLESLTRGGCLWRGRWSRLVSGQVKGLVIVAMTLGLALSGAAPAYAQATRTWVSGVGDDANPCSRTAPCKTFAGAISKTAAGGEISVLDPGGFGAVTITKAITIDGSGAYRAGILAASVNGIIINANATNDTVTLRNLEINGDGTGLQGIKILSAKAVTIESVDIYGFRGTGSSRGIDDERSNAGSLDISNATVTDNGQAGIAIVSPNRSRIKASISNSIVNNNGSGMSLALNASVTIVDCVVANSIAAGGFGIVVQHNGTTVNLERTVISGNPTGLSVGLAGQTEAPTVRLSESMIVDNTGPGVAVNAGTIRSFGNNRIAGNGGGDTLPPGSNIGQQ